MAELVQAVSRGGVTVVTISNPPVNALADPVLEQLGDAAAAIAGDAGVRAVVLAGAGERSFAAGADLRQFAEALHDADAMNAHVALTRRVFSAFEDLDQPIVAAAAGHAVGGGLELALLADFIVAEPSARFGFPEITLGLIPGAGGTQRLPMRVGRSVSTRMIMLGELIEAEDAQRHGLVDLVSEPGRTLLDAEQLAARLAALPGRAVAAAKRALRFSARLPLAAALDFERDAFLGVAASADAREGVEAFIAKRKPDFQHR